MKVTLKTNEIVDCHKSQLIKENWLLQHLWIHKKQNTLSSSYIMHWELRDQSSNFATLLAAPSCGLIHYLKMKSEIQRCTDAIQRHLKWALLGPLCWSLWRLLSCPRRYVMLLSTPVNSFLISECEVGFPAWFSALRSATSAHVLPGGLVNFDLLCRRFSFMSSGWEHSGSQVTKQQCGFCSKPFFPNCEPDAASGLLCLQQRAYQDGKHEANGLFMGHSNSTCGRVGQRRMVRENLQIPRGCCWWSGNGHLFMEGCVFTIVPLLITVAYLILGAWTPLPQHCTACLVTSMWSHVVRNLCTANQPSNFSLYQLIFKF